MFIRTATAADAVVDVITMWTTVRYHVDHHHKSKNHRQASLYALLCYFEHCPNLVTYARGVAMTSMASNFEIIFV